MKKILMLALIVLVSLTIATYANQEVKVMIDNKYVQFNQEIGYPFIDSASRTQVPFRATLEAFGASVSWDTENRIAIAEKDSVTVKVPIGEMYILKNNEKISNDTKALIKDGRTYLPIRVVMEAFGAKVDWKNNTVVIKTKEFVEAEESYTDINTLPNTAFNTSQYKGTEVSELTRNNELNKQVVATKDQFPIKIGDFVIKDFQFITFDKQGYMLIEGKALKDTTVQDLTAAYIDKQNNVRTRNVVEFAEKFYNDLKNKYPNFVGLEWHSAVKKDQEFTIAVGVEDGADFEFDKNYLSFKKEKIDKVLLFTYMNLDKVLLNIDIN